MKNLCSIENLNRGWKIFFANIKQRYINRIFLVPLLKNATWLFVLSCLMLPAGNLMYWTGLASNKLLNSGIDTSNVSMAVWPGYTTNIELQLLNNGAAIIVPLSIAFAVSMMIYKFSQYLCNLSKAASV